jgi:hypothetical protein
VPALPERNIQPSTFVASMSAPDRLTEIAEILTAGLMRTCARKSSELSHRSGENSLHFTPDQSGDATPYSLGKDA